MAQLQAENARLRTEISALHESMAQTENRAAALESEVAGLRSKHALYQGMFTNLSSFDNSFDSIRQSFFGIANTLKQEKESAVVMAAEANKSRIAFEGAADKLNILVSNFRNISTGVDSLNRRASEIGDIVKMIKEISDQANQLAHHATTETARSCANDCGFITVADEIKKIAERTIEASAKIAILATSIQGGTRQAKVTMEAGEINTSRCSSESEAAVRSMMRLHSLSRQMEFATANAALLANVELANIEELSLKLEVYKVFMEESHIQPDDLPDYTVCRLGQWYYDGEGKSYFSRLPGYREMEEPHKAVHFNAKKAIEFYRVGDYASAIDALAAMENANLKVMSGMKQMLADSEIFLMAE